MRAIARAPHPPALRAVGLSRKGRGDPMSPRAYRSSRYRSIVRQYHSTKVITPASVSCE
jgi:hypothetical protein